MYSSGKTRCYLYLIKNRTVLPSVQTGCFEWGLGRAVQEEEGKVALGKGTGKKRKGLQSRVLGSGSLWGIPVMPGAPETLHRILTRLLMN